MNVSNARRVSRARRRRSVVALTFVACVGIAVSGCGGGGGDTDPRVLEAGQVDIKLPPGFKVVDNKVVAPRPSSSDANATSDEANASGVPGSAGATPTTAQGAVPLDDDSNPTTDLLASFGKFRDCLQDEGVKFIGAPDASNPESPTNDPTYIEALSTCAARSNIVQSLQAAQAEQDTLTPEQIKERNKGYLKWRECMINRGWKIPKPTPDSKGRLFAFGTGQSQPQLEPPPGKDLFTSKDIEECSARAQRAVEGQG